MIQDTVKRVRRVRVTMLEIARRIKFQQDKLNNEVLLKL